jgi:hypothetical protein
MVRCGGSDTRPFRIQVLQKPGSTKGVEEAMMLDMDKDGDLDRADMDVIMQILRKHYGASGWPFTYILWRGVE